MARLRKKPEPEGPKAAFTLPPPHDDLFTGYGGGLDRLRVAADVAGELVCTKPIFQVPGPPGADRRGINEPWFEDLCDNDPELQQLLDKLCASRSFTDKSLAKISKRLEQIFGQALENLAQIFYANVDLTAKYFVAKRAHREAFGNEEANELPDT